MRPFSLNVIFFVEFSISLSAVRKLRQPSISLSSYVIHKGVSGFLGYEKSTEKVP
jgi:hypothetical protein